MKSKAKFNLDTLNSSLSNENELVKAVPPSLGIAIITLALFVVIIIVWGIKGSISEYVYGAGIVMQSEKFEVIQTNSNGLLMDLNFSENDYVRPGDLIGRVYNVSEVEQMNLKLRLVEMLRENLKQDLERIGTLKDHKSQLYKNQVSAFDNAIRKTEELNTWFADYVKKNERLAKEGAIPSIEVFNYKDSLNSKQKLINDYELQKKSAFADLDTALYNLENEIKLKQQELDRAIFDAKSYQSVLADHSMIISNCEGIITDIFVQNGEYVTDNQNIMRVINQKNQNSSWLVMAYLAAPDATKVLTGTRVMVSPSNSKPDQDGTILGTVIEVKNDVDSADKINSILKNPAFAQSVSDTCSKVPVRVKIMLSCNSENPSGFNWTSGKGPDILVKHGNLCSISIPVKTVCPFEIILGKIRKYAFGAVN